MEVTRCYKYRLYPTREQEARFVQFAGCRRFVWNWALVRKQAHFKATGKGIGFHALCAELVTLKKQPETAFLRECHSQVLQQALLDLDRAFVAFFEKRARYPRFKSRKRTTHAFRITQNVTIGGQGVRIPKVGAVKAVIHRPTQGALKSATVKQEAGGAWYVVLVAHVQLPNVAPTCERPAGLDVGLESFVTLSSGEKVAPPRFHRQGERKLKRLSRALSRCQQQSRRRVKAKARLARHHSRVVNRRNDWLHKLSARLVSQHDTLCIEDLNLHGLARTKLAKSFSDAALSTFLRQLEYKARWSAGLVVKVGRYFPSSKTCHACGHVQALSLSDRAWTCQGCGSEQDRDVNAARNILTEGLKCWRLAATFAKENLAGGTPDSQNARGADVRPALEGSQR